MSKYDGPLVEEAIFKWAIQARWPQTQKLTSQKQIDSFKDSSPVSVVFYGDKMDIRDFKTYKLLQKRYGKFRLGHVFEYTLNKKYRHKLPCLVVHSILHEEAQSLCLQKGQEEITHDEMTKFLDGFEYENFLTYDSVSSYSLFGFGNRHLILFIEGSGSEEEKAFQHGLVELSHHKLD